MNRVLVVVAALAWTSAAEAQTFTAKSGQRLFIWSTWNCQKGTISSGSGTAGHGSVTTKAGARSRCGNPRQPVLEYWYTSTPGFKGSDEVFLYQGSLNRRYKVDVR